jgi:hypothetical protein
MVIQRVLARGREFARIEAVDGSSRDLPAWMLNAAECAAMTEGAPVPVLHALIELRAMLDALVHPSDAKEGRIDEEKADAKAHAAEIAGARTGMESTGAESGPDAAGSRSARRDAAPSGSRARRRTEKRRER